MKKIIFLLLVSLVVFAGCISGKEDPVVFDDAISYCDAISQERVAVLNKYCPYYADFGECECANNWIRSGSGGKQIVYDEDLKNFYDYGNSEDYSYYFDKSTGEIRHNRYGKNNYLESSRSSAYVNSRLDFMMGKRTRNSLGIDTSSREGYVEYFGKNYYGVRSESYIASNYSEPVNESYLGVYGNRGVRNESYIATYSSDNLGVEGYIEKNGASGRKNESYTNYYGDDYRENEQYLDSSARNIIRNESYVANYDGVKRDVRETYLNEDWFYSNDFRYEAYTNYYGDGVLRDQTYTNIYSGERILRSEEYVNDFNFYDRGRIEEYTVLNGNKKFERVETYL